MIDPKAKGTLVSGLGWVGLSLLGITITTQKQNRNRSEFKSTSVTLNFIIWVLL